MAFQIDITEPALADADDYVRFIRDVRKHLKLQSAGFADLFKRFIRPKNHRSAVRRFRSKKNSPAKSAISFTSRIGLFFALSWKRSG